jgi:hypothetical protein
VGNYFKKVGHRMMKYLITGLESTCTRIASKLVAYNVGLTKDPDEWDAHQDIFNDNSLVSHRSIPHGVENKYINDEFVSMFDHIIITTRDWNCSLLSKVENHQHNIIEANDEHLSGLAVIKNILKNYNNVHIFSSETAFLLQDFYTLPFLKMVGIEEPKHIYFENPNRKYLKEFGL